MVASATACPSRPLAIKVAAMKRSGAGAGQAGSKRNATASAMRPAYQTKPVPPKSLPQLIAQAPSEDRRWPSQVPPAVSSASVSAARRVPQKPTSR